MRLLQLQCTRGQVLSLAASSEDALEATLPAWSVPRSVPILARVSLRAYVPTRWEPREEMA